MPPRKTRAHSPLDQLQDTDDVGKSRAKTTRLRNDIRDRVCTGDEHPGKPEDYRLVLARHRCVPVDAARQPKRTAVTVRQTKNEIAALTRLLSTQYPRKFDDGLGANEMVVMLTIFKLMVNTGVRLDYPDPEKRFLMITRKQPASGFKFRHFVMEFTLKHLQASIDSPDRARAKAKT